MEQDTQLRLKKYSTIDDMVKSFDLYESLNLKIPVLWFLDKLYKSHKQKIKFWWPESGGVPKLLMFP